MAILQRVLFRLFVWWQIIRQYVCALWFRITHWQNPQPHPWGHSAPSWYYPAQSKRTLVSRFVQAIDDCRDVTTSFKTHLSEPRDRPDVFVQSLAAIGYDGPLTCKYKDGMRAFYVTYRDMVVFPPSVAQTTNNPVRQLWSTLISVQLVFSKHGQATEYVAVIDLWKQFGGPAMDFYLGSAYETRPCDVYNHWRTENQAQSGDVQFILVFDGYEMSLPVDCDVPICRINVARF